MKSIRIGAIDFRVQRVDRLIADDQHTKLNGQISYNNCMIQLDQSLSAQAERQTLWHEVLHGVCRQSDVTIKEGAIDVLAYGIMAAIRDNPELGQQVRDDGANNAQ